MWMLVFLTRMKLGLFLFLQLKDGTLTSGYLLSWRTSHPLWVCPLRMRRGLNHCSSWGGEETHVYLRDRLLLAYIISFIIIVITCCFFCVSDCRRLYCILIGWSVFRRDLCFKREKSSRGVVMRLQSTHPLRGLLRQHVILLSEQQVPLFRRRSIQSCAAGIAHPVQRIVLENREDMIFSF